MMKKKGMSDIVVAMIMIVLVLVAVGIIWTTLRNTIESGAEQIDFSTKCLDVDIRATNLECGGVNNDICNVTLSRSAGGDDVAGVKLALTNSQEESNYIHDASGNIEPLETITETNINTGISDVSIVDVSAYFEDSLGNEQICSTKNRFTP